ncbi:MAG TPA: O-antigen ligase family protein [Terriglobales bacterium]|nr:O-antigen ligase family protein [Terriglobales bacterium]
MMLKRYSTETDIPWQLVLFLLVVFVLATWNHLSLSDSNNVVSADELAETVRNGSIQREIALLCLGAYGLVDLIRRRGGSIHPNGAAGVALICYALWVCVSLAWTADLQITSRAIARFILMGVAAIAIASKLTLRQLAKVAFHISMFTLCLSVIAELVWGSWNLANPAWRFSGLMHPVAEGWNCAVLIISALHLSNSSQRFRRFYRIAAGVGFVFLALTKSRMTLGCVVFALFVHFLLSLTASRRITAVFLGLSGSGTFLAAVAISRQLQEYVFEGAAFGRGAEGQASIVSLTGRLPLWGECLEYSLRHPLHGYGYNTFLSSNTLLAISDPSGWMSSPHSAYLGTFLELGIVGLVFLVATIIFTIRLSLYRVVADQDQLFCVSVLVWMSMNMALESFLLTDPFFSTFLGWILLARVNLTRRSKTPARPAQHVTAGHKSERNVYCGGLIPGHLFLD